MADSVAQVYMIGVMCIMAFFCSELPDWSWKSKKTKRTGKHEIEF